MKRIFSILIFIVQCSLIYAQQSVGIGTTTPNSKAILDISSTSKGILIPRMTTVERVSIAAPPNGLLVYDMDKNELYHYNGTGWRAILNGEYWLRSAVSPNRFYTLDSVGIGTGAPTQRLDISGNIRGRGDILADDNVIAGGAVQGTTVSATGNLVAVGTGLINGDLTTNSDIVINNSNAILQLKTVGENKAYFQLSGNNVRMGTNSGNSAGNLIVRMNGNDRVTINAAGDIDLDGKITNTAATGSVNLLPLCYGRVNGTGIYGGTSNFTVTVQSTGSYRISHPDITVFSTALAVPYNATGQALSVSTVAGSADIIMFDTRTGAPTAGSFYFIVYK
jgi:hypothetical protein